MKELNKNVATGEKIMTNRRVNVVSGSRIMTYNHGYTLEVRSPTATLKPGHVLYTCNMKGERCRKEDHWSPLIS